MANVIMWDGLKPMMRTRAGGQPQAEGIWQQQAAYAYNIFKWDPVTRVAGYLKGPASGITPGTTRYFGVALEWSGGASVLFTHTVMTDPGAMFEVQGDGSGSGGNVISAATMGYKGNLNVATQSGGNITRDNSGVQLTESSIATTSTLDMNIEGLVPDVTNAYGVNGRVMVTFNKHLYNPEVTAT
jgi:hypothetical protein